MITTKDIKNINILIRYLEKQHNFKESRYSHNYLLGALLSDKNRRSFGVNNYIKTHPTTIQNGSKYVITIHAEIDAINKWKKNWDITSTTLYVFGFTRNGRYPISTKPCDNCMSVISQVGIPRIVYVLSTNHSDIEFVSLEI
jgi:deoxycytidylate deaminase